MIPTSEQNMQMLQQSLINFNCNRHQQECNQQQQTQHQPIHQRLESQPQQPLQISSDNMHISQPNINLSNHIANAINTNCQSLPTQISISTIVPNSSSVARNSQSTNIISISRNQECTYNEQYFQVVADLKGKTPSEPPSTVINVPAEVKNIVTSVLFFI